MRKILMLILCLGILLALAACSNNGGSGDDDTKRTSPPQQAEESSAPAPSYVVVPERYIDMEVLVDENEELINNYSVMAVNPAAAFADPAAVEAAGQGEGEVIEGEEVPQPEDGEVQQEAVAEEETAEPAAEVTINSKGAEQLINWLYGDEGQKAAEEYGVEEHGQAMFQFRDNVPKSDKKPEKATDDTRFINLGVTSSMYESMLLNYLIPKFEKEYEYIVTMVPAGTTSKVLEGAKAGKMDLIIVQSVPEVDVFADEGFGYALPDYDLANIPYVYNYLILCGPSNDPAMVKDAASLSEAFANIAEGQYKFISRGDSGDIHTRELGFWPEGLAITADPESFGGYSDWYTSTGTSMYAGLSMAEDLNAYILADKSSFYNLKSTSVGEPPAAEAEN